MSFLERYKIELNIRTIKKHLSLWRFMPQKPLKLAYAQRHEEVEKWL